MEKVQVNDFLDIFPNAERGSCTKSLHQLATLSNMDEYQEELVRLLTFFPYPMVQILQICKAKSKQSVQRSFELTLLQLLEQNTTDMLSEEFINFMANLPLQLLKASLQQRLIHNLSIQPQNDNLYLALLCHSDENIIKQLLNKFDEIRFNSFDYYPTKEFIIYTAIKQQLHFVPLSIVHKSLNFSQASDIATCRNLLLLKIVNEFAQITKPIAQIANISSCLEGLDIFRLPAELQEIHKLFYADFQRLLLILDFLKQFPGKYETITVETLLNANCVLRLFFENDINASFNDTRRLLDKIHKLELQMSLKSVCDLEVETSIYFFVLSTILDVILADSTLVTEQYFASKMHKLNSILRQMRNIDVLCSLIEDIFQLVFLRWENMRHSNCFIAPDVHQFKRSTATKSSNPNSTGGDEIGAAIPSGAPIINGFICRGRALQCIFSFLKNFVTKKLHAEEYKNASERTQIRFQRIVEIISEAIWKYSVIQKIDDSIESGDGVGAQQYFTLDTEELLQLVQMHVDSPREKSSSDDDSRERCNYVSLTRRKAAKKRRRATISGTLVTQIGNNTVTLEQCRERANVMVSRTSTMQQTDLFDQLNARNIMMRVQDRSIIPRMLVSPENLAIMALAINNFNNVKYIIETFNLHNTELDRELHFMEQQRQVKQKLASIYANYQMEERKSNNQGELKATVEQIKNVVAKGFEASKIISVIDNFAQAQKLKQPENIKMVIMKHCSNAQYAHFLSQFEERNLNAVIITDLILNLPFNHEITTNIVMVIKRQQTSAVDAFTQLSLHCKEDLNFNPKLQLQLPKDIGCTPLLENLCQCLRLLDNESMRSLLCDSYYSLKPRKLALELERERAFMAAFKCGSEEFERAAELRIHAQLFKNLKSKQNYFGRFVSYVNQLAKLLKLRDKNLELHTSELLKYDPCDIIGELLFEQNMTPLEIESNVAALNLDLVHVIALNICPEIVGKCGNSSRAVAASKLKQKTIYNYIWNHNRLLAFLLQGIDKPDDLPLDNNLQPLFLQRLLNLPALIKLAQLYGGKKLIAALHAEQIDLKLIECLNSKTKQVELLLLKFGSPAPRKTQHALIDKLIGDLIREDSRNVYLAVHMHDIAQRANLIHDNFTKIATTRLAQELIESTLQHKEAASRVSQNIRAKLENTLADITVFAKVSEALRFENWPQAYDFGLTSPYSIFEKLLKMQHYKLCYKWCKVVKLSQTTTFDQKKRAYFAIILDALLAYNEGYSNPDVKLYLLQIMATFPTQDCCNFLQENKYSLRCVELLKYALNFLTENCEQKVNNNLKNFHISIVIFEQLNASERDQFWKLLKYPLLIIEQLIMNAKFEIMARVLKAVRSNLSTTSSKPVGAAGASQECMFCTDKCGNVYDIHARSDVRRKDNSTLYTQMGAGEMSTSAHTSFILLNFNLYQKDHVITNECIDLLLRIYATKALDYQMADASVGTEHSTTDTQQSIDSLWGAFQMPKEAPPRDDWIRDDEAVHCMCCRRAVFTMLIRRHHCRRCGRVVCFACSTHRMLIPALYADVEVRICNDCHNFTEATLGEQTQLSGSSAERETATHATTLVREDHPFKWRLSGNITHDKLLREEFCYEHAPSVALCLSILNYHLDQKKCVDLLLFHCRNMEKLIVPNPEVDYQLISKMMNCLALAAKVRGGRAEIETICDHSEIIMSLVQNGCESLIPVGPLKNHTIRKLADSLVQAEKWELALDVHLKYGFPTAGVMAAHGLSCLRAGCFDTAREKLSHCMPKLSHELANTMIYNFILPAANHVTNEQHLDFSRDHDFPQIKRPLRGPALLLEILQIIESIASTKPQPETLQRASIIRNSNTSLSSLLSRRKDMVYHAIPIHEPALNILTTLANLKRLAKGHYDEGNESGITKLDNKKHLRRQSRPFEEAIHYVLTYGSHVDIIQFLMRQQEVSAALKYCVFQNLEADFFIDHIFLVALRCGEVALLIEHIHALDARLNVWREVLMQTCRYLESKNLLNSLYQLQMLLGDPVRASMTCVKFYSMGCENFQQLHRNAQHLHNAHKHLLAELELAKWENISMEKVSKRRNSLSVRRLSSASATPSLSSANASFPMQMDARSLNRHINTILKQLDVGKFLANCERERGNVGAVDGPLLITEKILKQIRLESGKVALPTLFDSIMEKIQICILVLLSGKNIDEGFGLAYGVIQDYKIPAMKVFGATAKYLARNHRLSEVDKLLNCITSNNGTNHRELDDIIYIAIHSATSSHEPEVKSALDNLVKKMHNVEQRISCHIFMGQLKSAYLLANKYERVGDIKRILRQAEISNQVHMKKLCEKKLNINSPPI